MCDAHAASVSRRNGSAAQELEAAEGALADACDEVDKAERFFPVPGGADAAAQPRAAHGARAQPAAAVPVLFEALSMLQTSSGHTRFQQSASLICRAGCC
jgi:hypothetical protein